MKKIILALALLTPTVSQATLTAHSLQEVLTEAWNRSYTYAGHDLKFGFNSIDSCLWKSSDMLIIKNYCYPEKTYPARGFEIWSKKYGMIDVYEEKTPSGIVKRRASITQFPEMVQSIFPDNFNEIDFANLNAIAKKLYYRWNPACWSTNYDSYTQTKLAKCVNTDIELYAPWALETQSMVNDPQAWNEIFNVLSEKLKEQN